MAKKTSPVQVLTQPKEDFYVAFAASSNIDAINQAAAEFGAVYGTNASFFQRDFSNLTPNISGRPGLTRRDYDQYRPSERVPTKHKDIMMFAQRAYERVGLIRNIIDLMGDFACQGVRVSCANKRHEAFYRTWFQKIHGVERSERFCNNLYRTGNIIIRRRTASVDLKTRSRFFKANAKAELKIEADKIVPNEIPWEYIFLNPYTVDVVGENMSCFANKKSYYITIPSCLTKNVNKGPLQVEEERLLSSLPSEIRKAIQDGQPYMLPEDKTLVFHYKKDDWQTWAYPMTYSIFDDIILYEKNKLADSSALDAAITNIRIFRLGHIGTSEKDRLMPGAGAANKLKEILGAHTLGGTIDIVWGPDIDLIESKTDVYKFLGEDKYRPVLDAIYGGIGIPATLTGSGEKGGATNNFISLQTLIQRLEYGRKILLDFWVKELSIVQQAMGLESAVIEFDYMDLGDPASKNALLLQLSDRSLISDEAIQHEFKQNAALELARINRENQERDSGTRPPKVGPFYMNENEEDEEGSKKPKGVAGQGRPQNVKDTVKRKEKTFAPKSKASLNLWAASAQEKIAEILNPAILHSFGKKNLRSLTSEETTESENIKFGVLFNTAPFSEINKEQVIGAFLSLADIDEKIYGAYSVLCNNVLQDLGRELTLEEIRYIQIHLYGELHNED